MSEIKVRGKLEELGHTTQVLKDGDQSFMLETIVTKGEPSPWTINGLTGAPAWDDDDPWGCDHYPSDVFVTLLTVSLDEDGLPDMTISRTVSVLSIAC